MFFHISDDAEIGRIVFLREILREQFSLASHGVSTKGAPNMLDRRPVRLEEMLEKMSVEGERGRRAARVE